MKPPTLNDGSYRYLLALLAAVTLLFAGLTFFHYATMPTDENTFIDIPSRVGFATDFPATAIDARLYRDSKVLAALPVRRDTVMPRDLLLSIGRMQVRTMAAFERTVGEITEDTVTITVVRPADFSTRRFSVLTSRLREAPLVEQPQAVMVIAVTPGGASDRAGMRLGDFILRINGAAFKGSTEADRVMRQGTSGKANTYEITRDGAPLTLNVVLASFGFSLGILMLLISGVVFILVGTFIGLQRPQFFSARMLALWLVSLGYVIAVWAVRKEPSVTPFVVARDVLLIYAAFLGTTVGFHAGLVFPWQRTMSIWRKRGLRLMYTVAALSPLVAFVKNEVVIVLLFVTIPLMGFFVKAPWTREGTPQQRATGRPIRIVAINVIAGTFGAAILFSVLGLGNLVGIVGVFLVLIPLAYLYTIGHYRLLDMDLRLRRNVQYSLFSWLWGGLVVGVLIWAFAALPSVHLPLPHIVVSGFSVEVRQEPLSDAEQLVAQRTVAMILGVGIVFLLWKLRTVGQKLIDRKYFRTRFDYKHAAEQMTDILSTKLSMTDLAHGVVDELMELLQLKAAGLLVFRDGRTCCCDAASGLDGDALHRFAAALGSRFAEVLSYIEDPLPVDHLPADLAAVLDEMKFEYVIPIRSKGKLSGAIVAGQKLSESPHSSEDLAFLAGVGQQVSVSIENAFLYENLAEQERMRHELSIARQIQMDSLPSVTPSIAGLDVAGRSTPALEVGGDFFDYLDGSQKDLMVIVGDVSGKGTSAALYVSKVQGIIRSLHEFGLSPRELFLRTNHLLCGDLQKNSFITASAALFLPRRREVRLVRAGHLPIYIYHPSTRAITRVAPRGLGLGLSDAAVFASELEERKEKCEHGDILVLVTDGVTEARDPSGQEYGEERLAAVVGAAASLSASEIRDRIIADLSAYGSGIEPHDDQTVVVVRVV